MKKSLLIVLFVSLSFLLTLSCEDTTGSSQKGNPDPLDNVADIPGTMAQVNIDWPSLADSPWPMYRHDPQQTGRSNLPGPIEGKIKWKLPALGGRSTNGFTSFAIGSDSTIYFGSSYEKIEGLGQRAVLYAVSPEGDIKWTYNQTYDNAIERAPLVTADNTIIFSVPNGRFGTIFAMNSDGTLKWEFNADSQTSDLNIGRDGTIYFNGDGTLNALSLDGILLWQLKASSDFFALTYGGISISPDGNTLYVMGLKGYPQVTAVSTAGEIIWSFIGDSTAELITIPTVDNQGNIYFYGNGVITSLNPDGTLRWENRDYNLQGWDNFTMDKNGHIYIGANGAIVALDYSGKKMWEVDLPVPQTLAPLICDSDGIIYSMGLEGHAVSSINQSLLWEINIPHDAWQCPVIGYDGILYFGFASGDEGGKFVNAVY